VNFTTTKQVLIIEVFVQSIDIGNVTAAYEACLCVHDEKPACSTVLLVHISTSCSTFIVHNIASFLHGTEVSLFITPLPGREWYCIRFVCLCICLYVSLTASRSPEPLDRSSQIFLCISPVAMARSSSGAVAIRCVLPVSWIISCLAVVGHMAKHGLSVVKYSTRSSVMKPGQSLVSMNALFVYYVRMFALCSKHWKLTPGVKYLTGKTRTNVKGNIFFIKCYMH